MPKTSVRLPFHDFDITQLAGGHPVTEAAQWLQQIVADNVAVPALRSLELGSGNGIISLMLALQKPGWQLEGIEIQPDLVKLSRQNAARLGVKCNFLQGDLRAYKTLLAYRGYDMVMANPPWTRQDAGRVSPDPARAISRQEITCTMAEILACTDWCLNAHGYAGLIYPMERREELLAGLEHTGLALDKLITDPLRPHWFIARLERGVGGQSI